MLAAKRCAVDDQHRDGGGHDVDDADHGLVGNARLTHAAHGEQGRATYGERERVPVGGRALDRMAGQEGDGDAERRDLCERQVHEDDAAGKDVEPEIDVDSRQDEAGEEGRPQELEHWRDRGPQGAAARASVRRPTFTSKRLT